MPYAQIGDGLRLYHERGREIEAPSFYLHVQPGHCFIGAGFWHPEPPTLRRLRQFIHHRNVYHVERRML